MAAHSPCSHGAGGVTHPAPPRLDPCDSRSRGATAVTHPPQHCHPLQPPVTRIPIQILIRSRSESAFLKSNWLSLLLLLLLLIEKRKRLKRRALNNVHMTFMLGAT